MAEEPKEERLSNDEFRELIPYLELEDLFITQIIDNEKWIKIFESLIIANKEVINCNLCKKHVELVAFKLHLKEQIHKDALKDVKQFFHPVYTYGKTSEKLAKGELVSDEELTKAIKVAKAGLENQSRSNLSEAKRLSKLVQNFADKKTIFLQVDEVMKIICFRTTHKFALILESRNDFVRCNLCQSKPFNDFDELNAHFKNVDHMDKCKSLKGLSLEGYPELNRNSIIQADTDSEYAIEYNKVLIRLLEEDQVKSPHLLRIFCDLELEDLLKLEFLSKKKSWAPMLISLTNPSVFKCNLCNKTLIQYSLSSHCGGKQHKAAQLATQVRHKLHKKITNNYIFCLGSTYKVKTSLKSRKRYHNQVLQILKKEKKIKVGESKGRSVPKENEDQKKLKLNAEENEGANNPENEHGNETENDPEENEENENVETEENDNEKPEEEGGDNNIVEMEENEPDCDDKLEETEENLNETEDNLNETEETLNETEESLNETKENLNETEENLNETEGNLNETENIKESKQTGGNHDSAQQKELSIKIATKAKALRDASLNDKTIAKAKKLSTEKSKTNISSENITVENALVGIEYVVKILKHANDQEPMFECCLCEVLMNHKRMQNHLTGYNHRYKYCEMHYGNAFTKFSASLKSVKYYDMFRTMGPILSKLALEIEKVNGRSIPYAVSAEEFEVDRSRIIAQLYGDKHACQLFGPSFTNIFSDEDIKKILAEKDSFKAPKTDIKGVHCRFREIIPGQSYCNIKLKSERHVVFNDRPKGRDVKEHYSLKTSAVKSTKRPRVESSSRESATNNVWHKYRREILLSASEIERDYKEYRKCPDGHPLYNQEWNKFWKERKDDLVSKGIDPRNYNFQPDWVPYFKNRLEELFGEALEQAKVDVRIRLNIPLDAVEDSKINEAPPQHVKHSSHVGSQRRVEQQFEKSSISTRREPPAKKPRVDTASLVMQWNSQAKYGQNQSLGFRQGNLKVNDERSYASNLRVVDEKPDLVHVLRLMTAFEDYLGSLGPKVTDLLFLTLSLEKQIPNDINLLEQKILTPNNCSLLETAMEKLKGTLLAGLLDSAKEPGLNQVINCTTNLLTYADSMGYLKQFPTAQDVSQANRNPQFSSNIQELMNIMTGVKSTGPNRLNTTNDFSGSNPYAPPNTGSRFPDFQNQQFGNMRSSSEVASKVNMDMDTSDILSAAIRNRFGGSNNNAPRENYSSSQMPQRNMNMTGLGGNGPGNLNMGNFGRNNYNNPNLNNQNANNNDRNYPSNKGNMQNTGPLTGYWKPFPGGNANASLQQNSSERMWQQNNGNSWQSGSGMSGLQQQNFRQQQQRQKR